MKILITGAGGFIGQTLAQELLREPSNQLILTDKAEFKLSPQVPNPQNATIIQADLFTEADRVVQSDIDVVFVLHGIMSSGSEANFELGFQVNFDATRNLLESIRRTAPGVRLIYASSLAIYGRPFPEYITEDVYPTPEGSYGVEKLMCESLINEYTRRKFIDGFSVRLPSITVRPGAPAQAASSFLSGIIREPLAGLKCVVPTKDRSTLFWVCSPKIMIANLIRMIKLPSDSLPSHKRGLNAPGSLVSVQEMRDTLERVAGREKLDLVEETDDIVFAELVRSWPAKFDVSLALSLGLHPAEDFDHAVKDYIQHSKYSKE